MGRLNLIEKIERLQMREDIPDFRAGDALSVHVRIREGEKERVQVFEGTCIARHDDGLRSTFTVRKVSYGVGVERIFPLHSPRLMKIVLKERGRVRRSRLYYLRDRVGKAARVRALRDVQAKRR
ncbi:MAG: 50S ribosomal protein L19 [Myxococcota bacterium]